MKKLPVLLIILMITTVGIYIWWNNGISPVNRNDKSEKIFVVRKGAGVREIANTLKNENLIKDPVVFFLLVKQQKLDSKIQAGDFKLSPSQNAEQIAKTLTHGTLDIWITIPEGKRAAEIADLLKNEVKTYDPSWKDTLEQQEGYLFPDTYLIPKDATIETIISILNNNFKTKYEQIGGIKNTNLEQKEIVTIASLVEREAKHEADRPIVASVIINRLNLGMKLDIDATIQYTLGYQPDEKRWWKQHLTLYDLQLNSPYNTYKNAGLPPTPIANPGIEALTAVVNPAKTNYLYYISDKQGINHYAETFEQHQANIRKYGL